MSKKVDIRLKLPTEVCRPWARAAASRGLNLTAFITAVVSAELIRTGEMKVDQESPTQPNVRDVLSQWGDDV